jgi:hypothetical protein
VGFGRGPIPKGRLPVYSVGSKKEARALLRLTCSTNAAGDFVARELMEEQTLENLYAFGDRLRNAHSKHFRGTKDCTCSKEA